MLPALRELAPRNYGLHTAQQLVRLAQHSVSSGVALSARRTSLKILCDQLEHTQANLVQLEQELENLLKTDAGAKGLQSVPEFAAKTVAILRAELGDVDRFACSNQAVAYAGLDIAVKQSGKWKGEAKRVLARQRAYSAYLVYGRRTPYPTQRLRLWILLPSIGGSWPQRACSDDGGDAQDVGCSLSTLENPGDV